MRAIFDLSETESTLSVPYLWTYLSVKNAYFFKKPPIQFSDYIQKIFAENMTYYKTTHFILNFGRNYSFTNYLQTTLLEVLLSNLHEILNEL